MKFRSMIGFCALAVAAFGLESQTCGLMNVPSSAETTMIAVPWVTVDGSGDTMKVANLVKTDTLAKGDQLYYYDGSTYYCWVLSETGVWTPTTTTKSEGGTSVTVKAPDDADYAVPRGKSLFLVRQHPDTAEIWLYGQHSTAAVSTAVSVGSSATPVYSLIANPNATDYDLNVKNVEGAAGDQIKLGDNKTIYNYNGTDWTKTVTEEKTIGTKTVTIKKSSTDCVTIPAGQGAWYISKGGSPTIAW